MRFDGLRGVVTARPVASYLDTARTGTAQVRVMLVGLAGDLLDGSGGAVGVSGVALPPLWLYLTKDAGKLALLWLGWMGWTGDDVAELARPGALRRAVLVEVGPLPDGKGGFRAGIVSVIGPAAEAPGADVLAAARAGLAAARGSAPAQRPASAQRASAPAPARSNTSAPARSAPAPAQRPASAQRASAPAPAQRPASAQRASAPAPARSNTSAPAQRPAEKPATGAALSHWLQVISRATKAESLRALVGQVPSELADSLWLKMAGLEVAAADSLARLDQVVASFDPAWSEVVREGVWGLVTDRRATLEEGAGERAGVVVADDDVPF